MDSIQDLADCLDAGHEWEELSEVVTANGDVIHVLTCSQCGAYDDIEAMAALREGRFCTCDCGHAAIPGFITTCTDCGLLHSE
jgi:hypothetical protein